MSDKARVNLEIKQKDDHGWGKVKESDCPICINRKLEQKLSSFGISEKSFIVKDGKVFINSPVIDSMVK